MSAITKSYQIFHASHPFARFSRSVRVWFLLVAFLIAAKVCMQLLFPTTFADPSQAALFAWPSLIAFSVIGLAGVLLSERTGFPDAWSGRISSFRRLLLPVLVGMAWALIPIGMDRLTGYTRLVAARHGIAQQYVGFWQSLLGFSTGAILVEIVYRLMVIPLVLWLVSNLLFKKRRQATIFWILALLTSALEPLGQLSDLTVMSGLPFIVLFSQQYLFNLTQATFFRRYGFLASILVRVGFYFVWHTLYIH